MLMFLKWSKRKFENETDLVVQLVQQKKKKMQR